MRLIGAFGLARQMTFCVGVRFCPRPAGRGRSGAREVGDDGEQLRNIDAQWIKYVQMSDGRDTADARSRPNKDGCLSNRVPPGAGEMDAVGFVVDLLAAGTTAWSIEVCDASRWDRPGTELLRRCGDGMGAVLCKASKGERS
jgi:hypothetical protein